MLCLLGPVQKSKVVTMSTFLLHGTLHGGLGRLCQTPSQMSRMPSRASDSIQWNPRLPHKLHFNEISWTSCRNHRWTSRSQSGCYYVKVQRLFWESLCQPLCTLWQKVLWWLQGGTLWYIETWNIQSQQSSQKRMASIRRLCSTNRSKQHTTFVKCYISFKWDWRDAYKTH